MNWKPFTPNEILTVLDGVSGWFIDGGVSFDLYLGKVSRKHSDLDIGIYSSNKDQILHHLLHKNFEVYSANREMLKIVEGNIHENDYNYWVSDGSAFKFQLLVYQVKDNHVIFRRNKEVFWSRDHFTINIGGVNVINPAVSYAFKITTKSPMEKDILDIERFLDIVKKIHNIGFDWGKLRCFEE